MVLNFFSYEKYHNQTIQLFITYLSFGIIMIFRYFTQSNKKISILNFVQTSYLCRMFNQEILLIKILKQKC